METSRIDFISAYCDRWCERCAYTSRCSAYACHVAIAMCGDLVEGLELAVGAPHPAGAEPAAERDWHAEIQNVEMTAVEREAFDRDEAEREARIDARSIMAMAMDYTVRSHRWLQEHEAIRAAADSVLAEALEIVTYDSVFVSAKLHRALDGRDRYQHGDDDDEDRVQNDWNGSAKIALISLERSESSWRVIAQASTNDVPLALADVLSDLRRAVLEEFPDAMSFIRPDFDEPWR